MRITFLLRLGLKDGLAMFLGHVECSPWRNGQGALGDKKKRHRVPVQQELMAEEGKWKFIMKTQGDV